jgi:RNA polymerase sigma factor (sigma-70 family)
MRPDVRPLVAADSWGEDGLGAHALYARFGDAVFAQCLRSLRDREEAADVVQETFLNAWLALRRGVEPEAPHAWLATIARNLCTSRHRARGARIQAVQLDEEHDETPARPDAPDDLIALRPMLRRLPEQQRRAFLLYEIRGLSHREVAAELDLSYAAVATLVFRARRTLARGLAEGDGLVGRPRRAFGWGSLMGLMQPVLGSGTAVKIAAAVGVAPLVLLSSSGAERAGVPERAASGARVVEVVRPPLGGRVTVAPRPLFTSSFPSPVRAAAQPAARTARAAPIRVAPATTTSRPAAAPSAVPVPVDSSSGPSDRPPGPPEPTPPEPTAAAAAGTPGSVVVPVSGGPSGPGRQVAGVAGAAVTGPFADPGSQGQGDSPPADPGSQGQGNGPPADPGSQGNGPPADPGSQGNGNGPPADPGSQGQGNGPPADPGSQGQGNGPPADPGSQGQGNGPPADPGSQGQGNGPPQDPGSKGNPPPKPR